MNLGKYKIPIIIVAILLLVLVLVLLVFKNKSLRTKVGLDLTLVTTEENEITKKICSDDQALYQNDVIGIEFCFPSKWGDAKTDPVEYLTKLNGAVDEYSDTEHNTYSNSILISFSDNPNLNFKFFNEKYRGKYYHNSRAYDAGYIDNIPVLKSSGDICDYKVDFAGNWDGKDQMHQIWDECANDTQTSLVENTIFSSPTSYSYELSARAYKKMQNGYFDNLLVTYSFGIITQIKDQIKTISDFFNNEPKYNNSSDLTAINTQYEEEKSDFEDLVSSIFVYEPIKKDQKPLESIENENSDITLINKYFWLLSGNKLDEAYEIYADKSKSFKNYQSELKNFYSGEPRDFKLLSEHEYDFYLDYQEHNTKPTVYHYVAKISDNQITFSVTEEITTPIVKSDKYTAFGKRVGNKSYMVLKENDKEIIVDQGDADYTQDHKNIGTVKFYQNPGFSEKGNYLIYLTAGWEWRSVSYFDVKNKKNVITSSGTETYGINAGETHAYTCGSGGMSEAVGTIFSLSDGKVLYDVYSDENNKSYTGIACRYDQEQEKVLLTLNKDEQESSKKTSIETKIIQFDLKNNKVVE